VPEFRFIDISDIHLTLRSVNLSEPPVHGCGLLFLVEP